MSHATTSVVPMSAVFGFARGHQSARQMQNPASRETAY